MQQVGRVEAEGRIELPHIGFANRCITTLLLGLDPWWGGRMT